jgi:hypothetical protein
MLGRPNGVARKGDEVQIDDLAANPTQTDRIESLSLMDSSKKQLR